MSGCGEAREGRRAPQEDWTGGRGGGQARQVGYPVGGHHIREALFQDCAHVALHELPLHRRNERLARPPVQVLHAALHLLR